MALAKYYTAEKVINLIRQRLLLNNNDVPNEYLLDVINTAVYSMVGENTSTNDYIVTETLTALTGISTNPFAINLSAKNIAKLISVQIDLKESILVERTDLDYCYKDFTKKNKYFHSYTDRQLTVGFGENMDIPTEVVITYLRNIEPITMMISFLDIYDNHVPKLIEIAIGMINGAANVQ